jgi:hypothetical protein
MSYEHFTNILWTSHKCLMNILKMSFEHFTNVLLSFYKCHMNIL